MTMLGLDDNEYTAEDVRENLEEGEMSAEDAALYGATLAQEAYRNGDLSREEFHQYLDQAEQVTVDGQQDVELPDVDASVRYRSPIDEVHDSQDHYDRAREWVSGKEDLENADLVAVTGPQNIGVGANMADELGLEYTVMVAQDEDTGSLGPNADEDSVVGVQYGGSTTDVELHGGAESFDGKTTVVAGTSWGKNMSEADPFTDAPKNNSERMFSAVEHDRAVREWGVERDRKSLTETVREKLGF